jgi:transitional endoplasmic reticulum ATPase
MDVQTIANLMKAFEQSPDNEVLFWTIIKGYRDLDHWSMAYVMLLEYVPDKGIKCETLEQQLLAGEVFLNNNDPKRVLEECTLKDSKVQILRVQALLALEEMNDAIATYKTAIEDNPYLKDSDLEKQLFGGEVDVPPDKNSSRLRVEANDDTDESQIQRLLIPEVTRVCFSDVGGLEKVKTQIHKRIILPFQKPSLFKKFKKKIGGGILLYGPPGCGKTLLARATAGECKACFLNVSISDILDMYIGESERKLHAIFETARQSIPSVLFFDEIEALGGKRQYTREATSSKLVSQFLSEMDGFSTENQGILILGATNVPWAVDAAFRRPGRFDRLFFIPPPDIEARETILRIQLKNIPVSGNINYRDLAKLTSGYSGSDLNHLVECASDFAIEATLESNKDIPITNDFLKQALKEVNPTTVEWLNTARNYARYANEAGQYNDVLDFLKKHTREKI